MSYRKTLFTLASSLLLMSAYAKDKTKIPVEGLPKIWLQGEAITEYKKDTLYIFEFWATWCGPCIKAMPHMEELYQAFKGHKELEIVSINVMDRTPRKKLLKFLKKRKVNVTYKLAADDIKNGPVQKFWLEPLDQRGIPHVIAVRNGELIWRGHPNTLNKKLLTALLSKDFKSKIVMQKKKKNLLDELRKTILNDARSKKYSEVKAGFKKLAKFDKAKISQTFRRCFNSYVSGKNEAEAQDLAEFIVQNHATDAMTLVHVTYAVLNTEGLLKRENAFALSCANKVLELKKNDPIGLELKAQALFNMGKIEAAIALQKRAIELSPLRKKISALQVKINSKK